jgi:hypothetical protein
MFHSATVMKLKRLNYIGLLALTMQTLSQAAPTTCVIKGFEFLDAALKAGKPIATRRIDGVGDCTFIPPALLASPARASQGVTCQVVFFAETILTGDWQVTRIVLTDTSATIARLAAIPTSKLEMTVNFPVSGSQAKVLSIDTITLTTNTQDCRNWKSAL